MKQTTQTLSVLFASGLIVSACGGTEPSAEAPKTQIQTQQVINAASLNGLAEGELLRVDLSSYDMLTTFDQTQGAIDYSRIEIICPNGQMMPMLDWLQEQGEFFSVDFVSRETISFAADPFRFGLQTEEVSTLEQTRRFQRSGDDAIGTSGRGLSTNASYMCCDDGLYACIPDY